MSGIDYKLDKIRGMAFDVDGVLSPSCIPMSEHGQPMRMVNIKDGFALQLAAKRGLPMAIITGGHHIGIEQRYSALGVADIFQGASMKLPVLERWMERLGLKPEEVMYIGDDIPDIPSLRHVGLSCCPADAAPEVKEHSVYISPYIGGHGCVRDVVSQILKAKGMWVSDAEAFGW